MAELPERPKLAPGVRLHFDTTRQAWVLLGPERVIETEGPASEILRRCDGSRTVRRDHRRARRAVHCGSRRDRRRRERYAGRTRDEADGGVSVAETTTGLPAPLGLLAELTHRCPLACPYCSNPLTLDDRVDELDTATWARVFREAAAMGVLQVHLSGGEPASRRDLVDIVAAARDAGLYTNLITSAIGLDATRLVRLKEAGLDHVQLSLQDVQADSADHIAGYPGAHARKHAFAQSVRELGLALTVNTVIHRDQHRSRCRFGGDGRIARRRPRRNCARAVLRLGVAESSGADALAGTGRARDGRDGKHPSALRGPAGDRSCRAGLLCAAA